MRRGLAMLLVVLLAGGASYFITRCSLLPVSPAGWLCREYRLGPSEEARMRDLHREHGRRCGPYCEAMCGANAHLETLALGSGSVTPELRVAVAETDRIRTETRIAMLDHFYAVAAQLPPEKRREYLMKVLPLVIDSCGRR